MSADQYIVRSRLAVARQPDGFAEAPANAVADHGAADLLGHREAVARRPLRARLGRAQRLQQKPWPGYPGSAGNSAEFGAFPEALHAARAGRRRPAGQAESLFRPRARRAAMTLRPPFAPIRARKPCRRLRTSLLG